jgi:hypothetical protein
VGWGFGWSSGGVGNWQVGRIRWLREWRRVELPLAEDIPEIVDCDELSIDGIIGGLVDGCGEKVDGMKEAIFVGDFWRLKVVVSEFYCVGDH